jgi:hypothetical protein
MYLMQDRSRSFHSVSFWAGAGACLTALVLVVGNLSAAPDPAPAPQLGQLGASSNPLGTRAGEDECPVSEPIQCGETVGGSLTLDDCTDDQGRALDVYTFSGESGDVIDVSLSPRFFEGELEIYDPGFEDYAEVEGENPGQTVELQTTLDQTSDLWRIVVKTEDSAGLNGPYDLTLDCTGEEPPLPPGDEGFFTDPQYPDFEFRVRITSEPGSTVLGVREPDCIEDTVCVSGNLPGRSEVFLRILGPRPNGFLWPTIVRFTPSRVDVEVRRISTDETQVYTLARVLPGDENLSGRQDRTGFPE